MPDKDEILQITFHLCPKSPAPPAEPRALKGCCSEGFLCMSSMKVEGSSSHGRLLVAGRGSGRGPGGGRVDQSSIRAGSPMVSCGWGGSIKLAAVAQQGHDTHRARPDQTAGYRAGAG